MKITEFLTESKQDDWDAEDEIVSDPDQDKVPHILMQLKKSADVGGNYPITFKDGSKATVSLHDIGKFVERYMDLKPADREIMQDLASQSHKNFKEIIVFFAGEKAPKSLYVR